jgi:hypothetical protein
MFNATLRTVTFALFAEIDVLRLVGAALVGAAICGTVAAGRWVKARHSAGNASGGAVASSGGYYATIALVMTIGLAALFGGLILMTWNR